MTVSRTWNVVAGQFLSAAVALGVVVLIVVVAIVWLVHFVEARFSSRWGRHQMWQRRTGG